MTSETSTETSTETSDDGAVTVTADARGDLAQVRFGSTADGLSLDELARAVVATAARARARAVAVAMAPGQERGAEPVELAAAVPLPAAPLPAAPAPAAPAPAAPRPTARRVDDDLEDDAEFSRG